MIKIQKIMLAKTILLIILLFFNQNLYSQPEPLNGDLGFNRNYGYKISVIMEAASAPFEGITAAKQEYQSVNRMDQIQNGAYWRFYQINNLPTILRNIAYITGEDNGTIPNTNPFMDLGHCSGDEYPQGNFTGAWGFAKYKITITVQQVSEPINIWIFKFYLNSLDSKYQDDLDQGGYRADLYFEFQPINEQNIPRIRFYKKTYTYGEQTIGYIYTTDIVNGEPTIEYKVWEKVPPETIDPTKDFYAKSTPFPICPRMIHFHKCRVLELGTEVTLNGVNSYTGENDRFGYNTIDSLNEWSYNYYTNPPIVSGANVTGKTYVTPATFYEDENYIREYGFRLNVKNENKISISNNHRLWISGYNESGIFQGDTICFSPGSQLVLESFAQLNACRGGKLIDSSAIITWNPNAFMHIYEFSEIAFALNNNVVNNGGHIEVENNGTFKVCDNSTVTFDGAGTYLKLNPNSIVKLGNNAKIEFKNGAYLDANGNQNQQINISSINSSTPGQGFVFENAGASSITECSFYNLKLPVYINNTDAGYAGVEKVISDNDFNMDNNCQKVIQANFANNISILDNDIVISSGNGVGIYLNYPNNVGDGGSPPAPYVVNIIGNIISGGLISSAFICNTNSHASVNFRYNNCNSNSSNINILGWKITGGIKYNTVYSASGKSLELHSSDPDIFNNTFSTANFNIYADYSFPRLAPVPDNSSDGGWIWHGGKNKIYSTGNGNIYYYYGVPELDWGQNCFLKNLNYKHLWGQVEIEPSSLPYKVRNNDFNNSHVPVSEIWNCIQKPPVLIVPYTSAPNFLCSTIDFGTIWMIQDLGNGFYDTLYKTSMTSGYEPSQDEEIYNQAVIKQTQGNYFDAISYYKALITGFPSSTYSEACLYSLYDCYAGLDTTDNQSIRDILYTDLKNYLDGRILTGLYSDEFNYMAYDITLMCLTSIQEYNSAMSGYEFISLYHPEAFIRLLASWDYAEVQALLNGPGGISGKEEMMTHEQYIDKLIMKVRKSINEDPVKKAVKKSFNKIKSERTAREKEEINSKTKDPNTARLKIAKMKDIEQKLTDRALNVLRYSKTLTDEERDKQKFEDLVLTNRNQNDNTIDNITEIPVKYSLSQNYPNPFNPVTKISYAIPKQGLVTLKVYDILGREVRTLVNEVKAIGVYSVDFNGTELSSGVYFYRIKAGDYVNTKRMVLIK